KKIEQLKQQLNWGIPVDKLPVFTLDELKREVKDNGKQWIAVGGIIHDVTQFIDEHPGGKKLVRAGLGKDMTKAFNGGVYNHSNAARNLLSTMRVGVL
ncbi:cytochrome b5, partial [Ramicandelaber brevisporus]